LERNLREGNFLLLIVNDDLHPDLRQVEDLMRRHPIHGFALGFVELTVMKAEGANDDAWIVQPRIPLKTEIVQRVAVVNAAQVIPDAPTPVLPEPSDSQRPFFDELAQAVGADQVQRLQAFLAQAFNLGVIAKQNRALVLRLPDCKRRMVPVADINRQGKIWFWGAAQQDDSEIDQTGPGVDYLADIAALLPGSDLAKPEARRDWHVTSDGKTYLPLALILNRGDEWMGAIKRLADRFDVATD
jgi:hypothetical protein